MIAYVTSIGEATTDICVWQLKRFGFDVVLLKGKESWFDKYSRFIDMADIEGEDCLRVDADIIVNKAIKKVQDDNCGRTVLMTQYAVWDFYKNAISNTCPIYYSKEALPIIERNLNRLDNQRPECSASRLKEVHPEFDINARIVGTHGFFQRPADMDRAYESRKRKRQLGEFDFELVNKIREL